MQVLLQYRLIVILNCRLNYIHACAVDGGLGLWLSLGGWDFG